MKRVLTDAEIEYILDFLKPNKSIPIEQHDDYKSYMNKVIQNYFFNNELSKKIKDRLPWDFFSIDDIKYIIQ